MSALPEPAATIHRLTETLREDLAFAAPEVHYLHIEKRLAEAFGAGERAAAHDHDLGPGCPDPIEHVGPQSDEQVFAAAAALRASLYLRDALTTAPSLEGARHPEAGETCYEPVALYDVPYGEQYDPCLRPKGHDGNHDPTLAASPGARHDVPGVPSRMAYRDALTAAVHEEWHAAHKRAGGDGLCVGTAHERTFEDTANALLDPFLAALGTKP